MFAALALLMGNVLSVAEAPVADKKVIGKRIRILGRQQSSCLLDYEFPGALVADHRFRKLALALLSGGLLGSAAL